MSHSVIPAEVRKARGLTEYLIRISVGIEDVDDLIADLDHALKTGPQNRACLGLLGFKILCNLFTDVEKIRLIILGCCSETAVQQPLEISAVAKALCECGEGWSCVYRIFFWIWERGLLCGTLVSR
ncbi:putative cystathionine beta-lyase [Helianthus anomalus]